MTDSRIADVIEELKQVETRYGNNLHEYNKLNEKYTDYLALGNKTEANKISTEMKSLVTQLGADISEMKIILNRAYNEGQTRQTLSASAGSALELQDTIMERRMEHYKEARNRLEQIIGEENSTSINVIKNRNMYTIYFVFALALVASIIYIVLGGSLPTSILLILFIIGGYFGWEYYKQWLGVAADKGADFGSNVTGVFRMIT